ncbi:hypothetical protein QYE76_068873 [Lolium multiflorum]|uniref:Protein FAR1-RELATED SEQUENCE n=1 Tax=Lolium multiflorum TaxID=4521 RepID=A0AAD8SGB4_LOLMU|nr:hypothetical protein QYE76_068873 [Lolium multiflorum]
MASEDSKPAQASATAEPTSPAAAAAGEAPPNPTAAQNPSAAAAAGGAATDLEKKMRRAERFGTQVVMSEDEKRSSRAERFGTVSSTEKMEEQKKKSRAERFGLPSPASDDTEAKKKARLERFGQSTGQSTEAGKAEEEKRKARALRFAGTPSGGSKGNDKDASKPNPEDDQPAASGFVADSILQGFDLNKPANCRWMLAMNQMHPDHIMTDQDQAMATTIDKHMLRSFDMAENNHLNNMWKSRKTWAPVYFRKSFFPFTSTTGRSEGLNLYFKTLVRPSDSVWNFVQQYELCQNLMLDREDNAGFTMETTKAKLWGSYSIEEQALKFYTREVFDRFQKMVQSSTRFYPIHVEAEGLCFDLVPNQDLDVKTYRVAVNPEEGLYTCGCNMFEMCGLICPHIIRVMVHLNVQQIPGRYMLERWSAAATSHAPEPGTNTIRFGVPTTNTLKYNSLCRKMNQLASDACFDDDTYVAVSRIVDEASKVVATMLKAKGQVQQEGEGRPKITEKRRKTLVELRDEANEKRRKKQSEPKTPKEPKPKRKYRKKKCPFCGDEDHISVKECKYMKIALAREDAMQAGADLTL